MTDTHSPYRSQPFCEYKKVVRHTEDLARLQRLHLIEVDADEMWHLTSIMAEERNWAPEAQVEVSITGRRYGRGRYFPSDQRIVITDPAPLEVLVHELAHHDNMRRGPETLRNPHGPDFVMSLDICAEVAERRLADFIHRLR